MLISMSHPQRSLFWWFQMEVFGFVKSPSTKVKNLDYRYLSNDRILHHSCLPCRFLSLTSMCRSWTLSVWIYMLT